MNEAPRKKKIRKGPNYHRIPEVRARRRKIVTAVLVMLIVAWAGVSYYLMTRADPNIPGPETRKPMIVPVPVNPLELNKP